MDAAELKIEISNLLSQLDEIRGTFDVDSKEKEILEIENQLLEKEIWSDIEKSTVLNKRKTFLEKSLQLIKTHLISLATISCS